MNPELLILKVTKANIRKMLKDGGTLPFQNIRGAKVVENKAIEKGIRENLIKYPKEFCFLSQGVNGTCHSYTNNTNTKIATINFDTKDGQMNGGHLFKQFCLLSNDKNIPDSATLKIELWVGIDANISHQMPFTLNHSRNVTAYTVQKYNGVFTPIIDHWSSIPGSQDIGWIPNTGTQPGSESIKNVSLLCGLVSTEQSYRNMGTLHKGLIPEIIKIPSNFTAELLKFIDFVQFEIYSNDKNYNCKLQNLGRGYLKYKGGLVKNDIKTQQPKRQGCTARNIKLTFHEGTVAYELPKHIWCPLLHVFSELLIDKNNHSWVLGSLEKTQKFWSKYCVEIMNKIDEELLQFTVNRPGKKTDILMVKTDPKHFAENSGGDEKITAAITDFLKEYKKLRP